MKSTIKKTVTVAATLLSLVFIIASCGKKSENQAPVITIAEPANGDSVALTDSMHIEGNMTDDESLHEAAILVIGSTGDTAFQQYPTVHALKTYTFHYHFHPTSVGSYQLKVVATDHDMKSAEKTVNITAF